MLASEFEIMEGHVVSQDMHHPAGRTFLRGLCWKLLIFDNLCTHVWIYSWNNFVYY